MSAGIESESELIQTYLAPLASKVPGAFGLTDDAALLSIEPGTDLVVTNDPIIARRAFLRERQTRRHRLEGTRREHVGSCRQGRRSASLCVGAGVPRAAGARLDGLLCARAAARTAGIRLSFDRRRYRSYARPAIDRRDGNRHSPERRVRATPRRKSRRSCFCYRNDRRRGSWAWQFGASPNFSTAY